MRNGHWTINKVTEADLYNSRWVIIWGTKNYEGYL